MDLHKTMTIKAYDGEASLIEGLNPGIEGIVASLGGKRKGNEWTVPNHHVPKIKMLQKIYEGQNAVSHPPPKSPKSRLKQRRYRREGSDVESNDAGSSSSEDDTASLSSSGGESSSSGEDLVSPPRCGGATWRVRTSPVSGAAPGRSRPDAPESSYVPPGAVDPALLLAESSESSEGSAYGSSSDSDFPEGYSPRNHAQEYRDAISRRTRIERREEKRKLRPRKAKIENGIE